jgi:hypothetical protein
MGDGTNQLSSSSLKTPRHRDSFVTAHGEAASGVNESGGDPATDIEYDYSAKTKILLLSLTDFCPYFCSTADLDGKQFQMMKKRELMKPFNMHYNITQMI